MGVVGIIVGVIVGLFLIAILAVLFLYLKKVWEQYKAQNNMGKEKKPEKQETKNDDLGDYCSKCGSKLN